MDDAGARKRVVVVGSGVIGVSSAYFLAKKGCQVDVIDKRIAPAAYGTASHQNGGLLCYGAVEPWSGPSTLAQLQKSLMSASSPLMIRFGTYLFTPQFLNWSVLFWKACTEGEKEYRKRSVGIFNLSYLSARKFLELTEEHPELKTPNASRGTLSMYGHYDAFAADLEFSKRIKMENDLPLPVALNHSLDQGSSVADLIRRNFIPALHKKYASEIKGAIFNMEDSSGDCRVYSNNLMTLCKEMGVRFHFEEAVQEIRTSKQTGRVEEVVTEGNKVYKADYFVFATGAAVSQLLKIGVNAPIFPMKGYSLNVPIAKKAESEAVLSVAVVDEEGPFHINVVSDSADPIITDSKSFITLMIGFAELHGFDDELRDDRKQELINYLKLILREEDLDWNNASYYTCHRPVSPDDLPMIGETPSHSNLFLNLGHGSKGWTLAAGSGYLLSQLIMKEKPDIDAAPFAPSRFPAPPKEMHALFSEFPLDEI